MDERLRFVARSLICRNTSILLKCRRWLAWVGRWWLRGL